MLIGGEKYKKMKKKKCMNSVVLFCILSNKAMWFLMVKLLDPATMRICSTFKYRLRFILTVFNVFSFSCFFLSLLGLWENVRTAVHLFSFFVFLLLTL